MKLTTHFKKMPSHLKPREKALTFGVSKLSDVELLAIIIRSGSKEKSVIEVSEEIMKKYNSLASIENIAISDLMNIKGIGKVKALEIKSLFEFSKRFKNKSKTRIISDKDGAIFASNYVTDWKRESFIVLVIDNLGNVILCKNLYESHSKGISIEPNEIISLVLKTDNKSFYCFHNHPSGNKNPSEDDILSTERLIYFASLMNLELKGHIILTKEGGFSKINVRL